VVEIFSIALFGAVGFVLIFSAVSKLSTPARTADMFARLGVSAKTARVLAYLVATVEWLVGGSVLIAPSSGYVQTVVVLLFGTFALTGIFALVTGRQVKCACFGAAFEGQLGWAQLVQLLAVSGATVAVSRFDATNPAVSTSLLALVAAHLLSAAALLALAFSPWFAIRRQRVSLQGDGFGANPAAQQARVEGWS
jgi:hypothetical protein